MATVLNVPRRTYNAGQNFGPTVFNIAVGVTTFQAVFTNPSGWPMGDIATMDMDYSYDNGVTWASCGGMTINGDNQGLTDPFIGLISGATFKCGIPTPATSTTKGRVSASVLKTFTTAISVISS